MVGACRATSRGWDISSRCFMYCCNDCYTNSRSGREGETHGQTTPQAGHASHLKRTVTPTRPPNTDLVPDRRRGSASRSPSHPSCSLRSAARLSPLPASPAWSSGQGSRPGLASRCIRTCYGTLAAMPWPTGATTPGLCKPISGTKTSSIRCATPSSRRCGSRISGGPELLPCSLKRACAAHSFIAFEEAII